MPAIYALIFTAFAAPDGQIAFVSGTTADDLRACVMNIADGTINRVGPGCCDGAPVWSPGGRQLAFETSCDSRRRIWVVQADGSNTTALNHASDTNRWPRWSPQGNRLAYTAGQGADQHIVVCNLASGKETVWGAGRAGLMRPVWLGPAGLLASFQSADTLGYDITPLLGPEGGETGSLLALGLVQTEGRVSTDIFVVTQYGALPLPQWALPSPGVYAEWAVEPAPRGGRIAFESNDGGDREVFVLSKKGAYDATNHRAADWNPVWSPDGKWLAFESFRGRRRGIYRVYRDTVRVFPVAADPNSDNWHPAWSPDGAWIAFVSNRDGNPEIYLAEIDGSRPLRLTVNPGPDYAPAWRPEVRD